MKKYLQLLSLAVALCITWAVLTGQTFKRETRIPKDNVLNQAREMTVQVFFNLKNGESEKLAKWIVEQIGYTWDASSKVTQTNDFKSKLDVILLDPPASPYGKLDKYDLIDESYLPGSDRYFRMSYISYHQGAPLIWEFRFYVKPDGIVTLNNITWTEDDPFEYLSTNEMLLPLWHQKQ